MDEGRELLGDGGNYAIDYRVAAPVMSTASSRPMRARREARGMP
jgi:hypothetical protein